MKSWFYNAIICAVFLGVLPSCKGPFVPVAKRSNAPPLQHTQRILVLDNQVRDALLYINSVQKRLSGGQILVQANFQNRFPKDDIWAEAKIEFLDGNNMLVDQTEWVNTYFPAWEVTMLQGNSISANAVRHVILLKNLRTRSGRIPATFGFIFEVPWFPTVLPK